MKYREHHDLAGSVDVTPSRRPRKIAQLFYICLIIGQCVFIPHVYAENDHDLATPPSKPADKKPQTPPSGAIDKGHHRAFDNGGSQGGQEGCHVQPGELAGIANGENPNIQPVVTFLTSPQCALNAKAISQEAIPEVVFNNVPFHLDTFARGYSGMSVEGAERIDRSLANLVPPIMREHPMPAMEQIPLIAQFSLLSRTTGIWALTNMIKQELISGATLLPDDGKITPVTTELAKNLVRMGANETAIASELANSVEEMALMSEADSLGKVLRSLSAVATAESSLVPTFNLSAGAFNRSVQRGIDQYKPDDLKGLSFAAFQAARASVNGNHTMEPGVADVNEAFGALLAGKTIEDAGMKKLWKEIVRVLALTPLMPNLADAISSSITPQIAYLDKRQQSGILAAAKNYPQIAIALQKNFLIAWTLMREDLHNGKITVQNFNEKKEASFEPMVASLLDMDPDSIDPYWLKEVVRRGLVKDETIEKKFPRLVLALIDRRDKASKTAVQEDGIESTMSAMAQNFGILWTLSSVHVPALRKWVEKYDE